MLGLNLVDSLSHTAHVILMPDRSELNCLDGKSVSNYIAKQQPEMVIHCAGTVGGISANIASPYLFFKDNMLMGINVIDACINAGVKELINISSTNIYPDDKVGGVFFESDILSGKLNESTEGYGLAKGCTAKVAEYASNQFGVSYRSIVSSNLYGRFDSFSTSKAHMIPAIIRRLHEATAAGVESVEIWGDGSARRGFLFAEDLTNFIADLVGKVKLLPQNINVCPTYNYSVYEYNKIIADIVGYEGKFHFNESMPTGSKQKNVNFDLASSMGWVEKTSIEKGIQKTYGYFLGTSE